MPSMKPHLMTRLGATVLSLGIVLGLTGCSSTPTTMGTGQKIVLKSLLSPSPDKDKTKGEVGP